MKYGIHDILGRLPAQKLSEALGQQVVVDNRPGASGIIGVEHVVKSAPDGYALPITQNPLAINPIIISKLPYDAPRDFAPISRIAMNPNVLTVHPSVPAKSVKVLIALAEAKPGMTEQLTAGGMEVVGSRPGEFASHVKS